MLGGWDRDTSEQGHHFGLTAAAGLFQHAPHMRPYCVAGNAAIGGHIVNTVADGQAPRYARLRGREVEQRLN